MAKKKSSAKSKASATPKRSSSKPKAKPRSQGKASKPKQQQIKFPSEKKTSRQSPVASRKKYSKPSKPSKPSRPSKPRVRNFKRTYLFKEFKKKFGKEADKKFWKKVEKYWQTEYDKKKRPATVVKAGITKKFVRTVKNRFQQTKKPYMGVSAWKKDKNGVWKKGKPVKRYFWRDKLTGELLRGKQIGARMRKVMEPDLIRGYMKKHGLKNYHKARKRFLKETKNSSIRTIVWLYGASP